MIISVYALMTTNTVEHLNLNDKNYREARYGQRIWYNYISNKQQVCDLHLLKWRKTLKITTMMRRRQTFFTLSIHFQ